MSTFTWSPDQGATQDNAPRILSVIFGDGYEQRALDGLNANMVKRSLTFSNRPSSDVTAILSFLDTQAGIASFTYTHPGDIARQYVCKTWKATDASYNNRVISADFTQVPL